MSRAGLGLAFALAAGCSLTTSLDDLTGGATDAGAKDAPAEADAREAGGDARADAVADAAPPDGPGVTDAPDAAEPPSLVYNGGFEDPAATDFPCGAPWGPFESTLVKDPNARSGAYACKVCKSTATTDAYTVDWSTDPKVTVSAGDALVVRAWVRALPGDTGGQTIGISARVYNPPNVADFLDGPTPTLTQDWQKSEFSYTVKAAGELNVYVHSEPAQVGACFLVDDVYVGRVK